MVVDVGAALRTFAEAGLAREVDRFVARFVGLVLAEVEFRFHLVVQLDGSREGTAHLVAEAGERADLLFVDQGVDFGRFELATGDDLPQRIVAAAALEFLVGFADLAAAARAFGGQHTEIAGNGIGFESLGTLDHVARHFGDFAHELVAREFALFDAAELPFPVAGQFRLGQFVDAEAVEQRHQREGLGGRDQFAAFAQHVLLADQVFDDLGARRRRAEAAPGHCRLEFLVVDHLAGAFHGGEQGGFRVARRRLGFVGLDRDFLGFDLFVLVDRNEIAFAAFLAFLAMHGEPARIDQDLAFGLERVAFDAGDAGGHQVFGGGEEDGEETADDKVVEFLFDFVEILGRLRRRNDREVVADLGVVEDALVRHHPVARQDLVREGGIAGEQDFIVALAGAFAGQNGQGLAHRRQVVFGQAARIGPRVGQDLVLLVERLGDRQRGLGREAETGIGFALQAGQIEEQW